MHDKYPVKAICDTMDINKSGYYKWLNRQKNFNLSPQKKIRAERMSLFKEYGNKYRTHGYKWLNAKIKLDKEDFKCSDETARQICKFLGIKSISKHEKQKYRKPRKDAKNYQNLILNQIAPEEPFSVVVSDMTVIRYKGDYHEVTFYMDLFNNEIVTYAASDKKGDPATYHAGLNELIIKKQEYKEFTTILHTDGGPVYASHSYNKKLYENGFIHSMSAPGRPTENGAMESINGWVKEELLRDFMIDELDTFEKSLEKYIYYFNYERPAAALNYLTPMQYKQKYYIDNNIK